MNHQLWKMETPHIQTMHNQKKTEQTQSQELKLNKENLKKIMIWEKTTEPS